MRHWNRSPTGIIDVPSLETFKVRLDRALSNLIELNISLLTAGFAFKGSFNQNYYGTVFLVLYSIGHFRSLGHFEVPAL